jgi:hypothetical protein
MFLKFVGCVVIEIIDF